MVRKRLVTLADGEYVAKCRQPTAVSAAVNGHAEVWPQALMVVEGDTAIFYRDGERVWSCSMLYAANQFDVTPVGAGGTWEPGWRMEAGNAGGTAHLYLRLHHDGKSAVTQCGRLVLLSDLQSEARAKRRCGNCLKHR